MAHASRLGLENRRNFQSVYEAYLRPVRCNFMDITDHKASESMARKVHRTELAGK
jgi:hypothetical protein